VKDSPVEEDNSHPAADILAVALLGNRSHRMPVVAAEGDNSLAGEVDRPVCSSAVGSAT
jgi:hypothetical protein